MRQVLLQKCSETKTALHWLPCSNHIHGANERVDDVKNVVNAQANKCFTQHYLWQFFQLHLCVVFCKGVSFILQALSPRPAIEKELQVLRHQEEAWSSWQPHHTLEKDYKKRRTTQRTLKPMKSASITLAKVATVFFSNSPVTCPTLPNLEKKQDERNKTWTAPAVLRMKDESIQQTTSRNFKYCAAGALLSTQVSLARGNTIVTPCSKNQICKIKMLGKQNDWNIHRSK